MLRTVKSGVALATLSILATAAFSTAALAQSKAKDLECKGCVGTKDLKKKAVKGSRLSNNAVTTDKIKDGTIGLNDLSSGLVGAIQNPTIPDNAITSGKIQDGTIGLGDLSGPVVQAIADPNLDPVAVTVSCPGQSIQDAVDAAVQGQQTTIFITGTCTEDVLITTDDVTLSGNQAGSACDTENPGGTGTIEGSVDILGVRANVEFLTITGSDYGLDIGNRATSHLTCNNVFNNQAYGIAVFRSSNAVLEDNTVVSNGLRSTDPEAFFDCGLFVSEASSVRSLGGNSYDDHPYCAVEVSRQSSYQSGDGTVDGKVDFIVERDCAPETGGGCLTEDYGPIALGAWLGGQYDVRNAEVGGEIRIDVQSSFQTRFSEILGKLIADNDSRVRVINDNLRFEGELHCNDSSDVFYSDVDCEVACTGDFNPDGSFECSPLSPPLSPSP